MNPLEQTRQKRKRLETRPTSSPRISQRVPQSCLECARRKIKCDRSIPCRQCTDRGDSSCRREYVVVAGEASSPPKQDNITFDQLVAQVQRLQQEVSILQRPSIASHSSPTNQHLHPSSPGRIDHARLPGTMEEAALGIGAPGRWADRLIDRHSTRTGNDADDIMTRISTPQSRTIFPSRDQCQTLSSFYFDHVSWMSGAILDTNLADHLERLSESDNVPDDIIFAAILAVICVAAFFMTEGQANTRGLPYTHLPVLAKIWFDAAIAILYRCNVTTRPSLLACQTIDVLGPAFHFTNNTALHGALGPMSMSHAYALNLHLLGGPEADVGDERLAGIGRRVWWNLVEGHWTFLPYFRYCSE